MRSNLIEELFNQNEEKVLEVVPEYVEKFEDKIISDTLEALSSGQCSIVNSSL